MAYSYDNDGNVQTKTDARNITTTYAYDSLNRLTGKTYASGGVTDPITPAVTLTYDQCPGGGCPAGMSTQNLAGRLVAASTTSATTFNSYDTLGRITNQWQCTPVKCGAGYFNFAYGYDLGGDLTSESNGFGVTLSYAYDSVDRLQSAASSLADATHPATLLSQLQYGPMGVTAETLGNGVTESLSYNNRGNCRILPRVESPSSIILQPRAAARSRLAARSRARFLRHSCPRLGNPQRLRAAGVHPDRGRRFHLR